MHFILGIIYFILKMYMVRSFVRIATWPSSPRSTTKGWANSSLRTLKKEKGGVYGKII